MVLTIAPVFPEPPGAPTNVGVTQVVDRSAFLQFTPGYDGKTLISKWIVEAQIGDSSQWVMIYNVR